MVIGYKLPVTNSSEIDALIHNTIRIRLQMQSLI